jgi:MFS family permease
LAAATWGYGAPFLLQGILSAIAIVLLLSIVPRDSGRAGMVPTIAAPAAAYLRTTLRAMAALAFLAYGVFLTRVGATWVVMPLIARHTLAMSLAEVGVLLTVGAIANLMVLPVVDGLAKRIGCLSAILLSTAMGLAGLFLLADASGVALAWLGAILLGMSTGLAAPILSAYAIDAAPEGGIGAAMGLLRTVIDLAIITGPALIGFIVDQLAMGYSAGLWFCGILLGLASCSSGSRVPPRRRAAETAQRLAQRSRQPYHVMRWGTNHGLPE